MALSEMEIMEWYELTKKYVEYNYYSGRFFTVANDHDCEDLVSEIFMHFMEKGFFEKYNPKVTSKAYHVANSVRTKFIDLLRKHKNIVSFDAPVRSAESETTFGELYASDVDLELEVLQSVSLDHLLNKLPKTRGTKVFGETPVLGRCEMSPYSVAAHLAKGYVVKEIAVWFVNPATNESVKPSTIHNVIREIRMILA